MARIPLNTIALNQSAYFTHAGVASFIASGSCVAFGHKAADSDSVFSAWALLNVSSVKLVHGCAATITVTSRVRAGATEQQAAFALFSGRVAVVANPANFLGNGAIACNVGVAAAPNRVLVLQSEEVNITTTGDASVANSDIYMIRNGFANISAGVTVSKVQVKINTIAFGEAFFNSSGTLVDASVLTQSAFSNNSRSAGVELAANASQKFASAAAVISSSGLVITTPGVRSLSAANFESGVIITSSSLLSKLGIAAFSSLVNVISIATRKITLLQAVAIRASATTVAFASNKLLGVAECTALGAIEFIPTQKHEATAQFGITVFANVDSNAVSTTSQSAAEVMVVPVEIRLMTVLPEDRTMQLYASDTTMRIAA